MIHVVFQMLAGIVNQCLQEADNKGYRSIAFPAIGTGGLGVATELVADVMLGEMQQYSASHPTSNLVDVRCVVYEKDKKVIKVE